MEERSGSEDRKLGKQRERRRINDKRKTDLFVLHRKFDMRRVVREGKREYERRIL